MTFVRRVRASRLARDDAELADLVTTLHETSAELVERWTAARPTRYRGMRKHVDHPGVGPLLDGDVL